MQTWGFLKHRHRKPKRGNHRYSSRGFTLLEMLTVLFVVGLSASLVLPNLPALFDRLNYALERDSFIRKLNDLPQAALKANQDFVLIGDLSASASINSADVDSPYVDVADLGVSVPYRSSNLRIASLDVPQNWKVNVPEPIFFRSSGFCTGGRITVETEHVRVAMSAKAPYCVFSEE